MRERDVVDDIRDDEVIDITDVATDDPGSRKKLVFDMASQSDDACFRQVVEAIPDAVIIQDRKSVV